jgi:50S ribosomal subunit-associated GTPase HflX
VADQLFATLDPTVRQVKLAGVGDVVLADTVGFVRALPHELVAAFRSTLQEARDADLLLHVVDASDPLRHERILQVREVLKSIGAGDIRELLVFNKLDLVAAAPDAAAAGSRSAGVARVVSGSDGEDLVAAAPDAAAAGSRSAGVARVESGSDGEEFVAAAPDAAAADSRSAGVARVESGSDGEDFVAAAPDAAEPRSAGVADAAAAAGSGPAGVPRVVTGSDGVATQAWVSAVTGAGLDELRAALPYAVRPNQRRCTLHLGLPAAAVRSDLYRRNAVRSERQCDDGSWELDVELDSRELTKLLGGLGVNLVADTAMDRAQRVA